MQSSLYLLSFLQFGEPNLILMPPFALWWPHKAPTFGGLLLAFLATCPTKNASRRMIHNLCNCICAGSLKSANTPRSAILHFLARQLAKSIVNISYFALFSSPNSTKHSKYKLFLHLLALQIAKSTVNIS